MEDYYNPKKGLGSAYKYYKSQDKYTYKQIQEMLNNQEAYQLNKQGTKTYYFPIVGHGKGSYQADLMFLDNDRGYNNVLWASNTGGKAHFVNFNSNYFNLFVEIAQIT